MTYTPEATFQTVCNAERYAATILEQGGPEALAQWRSLEREMAPLQQGAATFPAAALRSDFGEMSPEHSCTLCILVHSGLSDAHLLKDEHCWLCHHNNLVDCELLASCKQLGLRKE